MKAGLIARRACRLEGFRRDRVMAGRQQQTRPAEIFMSDSYERAALRAAAAAGEIAPTGLPLPPLPGMASIDPLLSSLAIRHGVPAAGSPSPAGRPEGAPRMPAGLLVCPPVVESRVVAALLRLEQLRLAGGGTQQEVDISLEPVTTKELPGTVLPNVREADQDVAAEPAACRDTVVEPAVPEVRRVEESSDGLPPSETPRNRPEIPRNTCHTVDERRAFPRHESSCRVSVSRLDAEGNGGPIDSDWQLETARRRGELLDLSRNGAAFTLNEQPADGERLRLRLQNLRNDTSCDMTAHVVRTTREPAGQGWRVYCSFEQNLAFEHVLNFGHALFRSAIV